MEPERLIRCPICQRDLPESEFGICRARPSGRNLYDKACIRVKVQGNRDRLREYKQRTKEIQQRNMLEPDRKPLVIAYGTRQSPADKVEEAIRNGARTQTEIQWACPKLTKDEITDGLAVLYDQDKIKPYRIGETAHYQRRTA